MNDKWYIQYNGQQVGPMSANQLLSYGLTPNTMVWREGSPEWVPAYMVPELMELLNNNRQSQAQSSVFGASYGVSGKSKIAAALFAFFLGWLGVQYFYCGKTNAGLICILLHIITCGLWSIVDLVQAILMLTMDDYTFEAKYVTTTQSFPLF